MKKMSDRRVREYLLKKELDNFFIENLKILEIKEVQEFYGIGSLFSAKKDYRIFLRNDKNEKYIYNSKNQELTIEMFQITVKYIQDNLNDLIKLENLLKKFFEERKDKNG